MSTTDSEIAHVLARRFDSDELRRLIVSSSGDLSRRVHEIAWHQSMAGVTYDLVNMARRSGNLPELLWRAAAERPSRECADIQALAAAHPFNPGVPVATAPWSPRTESAPKVMVYKTTPEVLKAINGMLDDFEPIGARSTFWLLTFIQNRIAELATLPERLKSEADAAHKRDPLGQPSVADIMSKPGAKGADIRAALTASELVRTMPAPSRGWSILRQGGLEDTTTRFARAPLSVITADHVNAITSLASDLDVACRLLGTFDVVRAMCIGRDDGESSRLDIARTRLESAMTRVHALRALLVSETKAEADPFAAWGS